MVKWGVGEIPIAHVNSESELLQVKAGSMIKINYGDLYRGSYLIFAGINEYKPQTDSKVTLVELLITGSPAGTEFNVIETSLGKTQYVGGGIVHLNHLYTHRKKLLKGEPMYDEVSEMVKVWNIGEGNSKRLNPILH